MIHHVASAAASVTTSKSKRDVPITHTLASAFSYFLCATVSLHGTRSAVQIKPATCLLHARGHCEEKRCVSNTDMALPNFSRDARVVMHLSLRLPASPLYLYVLNVAISGKDSVCTPGKGNGLV